MEKLLGFVATCLENSGHLQFYMMWAQNLLMLHGQKLKNRCVTSRLVSSLTCLSLKLRLGGVQVSSHSAHAPSLAEEHPETRGQSFQTVSVSFRPCRSSVSDQCLINAPLCRCDFNMYNIRYAAALSRQRGLKRTAEDDDSVSEDMSEASSDAADMMML